MGFMLTRLALALSPLVLLCWYYAGGQLSVSAIGLGVVGTITVVVLRMLGRRHGQTAWNPGSATMGCVWAVAAPLFLGVAFALGFIAGNLDFELVQ